MFLLKNGTTDGYTVHLLTMLLPGAHGTLAIFATSSSLIYCR